MGLLPHDNWAKYYDFVYEQTFGNFYTKFTNDTINTIGKILEKGTILDFGAGTGRLSIPLSKQGYKVIAVEQSIEMVNEFNRKIHGQNLAINIHNCSISEYNNGNADLALALFTVLSYSITEEELSNNIKNICKHINPKGYFFFDLPNRVFFNTNPLINISRNDFKRHVSLLNNNENDIFTYREQCSGIFQGQEFNYEDKFKIRYWEIDTLDKILGENGFRDSNLEFPEFYSTGSTYKLYKRI